MTLGSTQPLTEIITPGLKRPVPRANNLATFMCRLSIKTRILEFLEPKGPLPISTGSLYLDCSSLEISAI